MALFPRILDIVLERNEQYPMDLRSLRLVSKESLQTVDRGIKSLRYTAGDVTSRLGDIPTRFPILRTLDLTQSQVQYSLIERVRVYLLQVQSMNPFFAVCKQLRTIRCTLKQALATDIAKQDLDVTVVRGDQDDGFANMELPAKRLTIELSSKHQGFSPSLLTNLQHLVIEGFGGAHILYTDLHSISSSMVLESLTLRHCIEPIAEPLSLICQISSLTSLDFSYNLRNSTICDKFLSCLEACSRLKDLDVSFTKITSVGLKTLTLLEGLTRLAANSCEIEDDSIQLFSGAFPNLETLEFASSWDLKEFRASPSVVFENLARLDVSNCFNLDLLSGIPNLQSLSAGGALPGGLGSLTRLAQLTYLDISHKSPRNVIDDRSLTMLTCLVNLQHLNVDGAVNLGNVGIMACTALTNLTILNVSRSKISAIAVNALSCLSSLEAIICMRCESLEVQQVVPERMKALLQVE